MLAGAVSWLGGAALWVTATSYVRRNHFEARIFALTVCPTCVSHLAGQGSCVVPCLHSRGTI